VKIGPTVRPGRVPKKERTGQNRTVKKVTKVLHFT